MDGAVALKPFRTILQEEVRQAIHELNRPALGLVLSGVIAGFGLGTSMFLVGAVVGTVGGEVSEAWLRILSANAYTVGFVLVILANTDLFTEYSTMALLPVLEGRAPVGRLLRFWTIVYAANLAGGAVFVLLMSVLGPRLEVIEPQAWVERAARLTEHAAWVMLLSAALAGWLMGMLAWLVTAGRDTISQIVVVWLVTGAIAIGHLHHCISGTMEVAVAMLVSPAVGGGHLGQFLLWTTAGNIVGSILFALLIHYSALIGGDASEDRAGGRAAAGE